jgi:integrase
MVSLPAAPGDVAAFLSDEAATHKITTLRRYLASISVVHTIAGEPFDRRDGVLKTVLKGIARTNGDNRRKVKPLMSAQVRALLAGLGANPKLVRIRDGALLALGVASGCRRSEIAGLDAAGRRARRGAYW